MARKLLRGQHTLPPMPSQDAGDEVPVPKNKKKKVKRGVDSVDDPEADPGMEMGGVNSRRASQASKPVTPDPEGAPQKRRRKKKAATIDLEDDQADLVNGGSADQNTDGEEVVKKPKKKKKPKGIEPQYTEDLDVEEDDIISDGQPSIPHHSLFSAPLGQSQPVGKMFVERTKRFQPADHSERQKTSDQTDNHYMEIQPMWTTRDVSLKVHSGFRVLGLFCNGFLAGYAVWNIIIVYVLAGRQLTALPNLLLQYHTLAYPTQSLLFLLLAISTVSAFDRVNLANGPTAIKEFVTLDPVALASFLYFSALVLSLSQQMTSDRINLYSTYNQTLWPPGSEQQVLHPWVIVNLVVALLVGLAWIFISTRPEMDYTESFLMAMKIDPEKPEEKPQMA
ncbi:transmembrane protein 237B-like isoform X1 [Osmerus eperlanus]|uniref:transmembrane protein 237B-like isoform X1 n=1 Tax=Osmerus eperlanus TaxID=29151 RepID=UPI002E0E5197